MSTASRRPEHPTEKRQAVEAAVLRAIEELLAEGATYASLSVERIATRAGISRTAFYFYFADKRELLMRLTEGVAAELWREADAWWSGSDDGPAQVTAALRQIAERYVAHGPLVCAIVEVSTYDEVVGPFWRSVVGRFVDATAQRIAVEQAEGRSDPALDARSTAFALVWMTERALHQMVVQESAAPAPEQLAAALARIWSAAVYGRR